MQQPECDECGTEFSPKRKQLGYLLCLKCGEKRAKARKFAIVPMHKSNYIPVFDTELLLGINSKTHRG